MGAWGYGLFESDHDNEMVEDLNDEAGLLEFTETFVVKTDEAKYFGEYHKYYDKSGNEIHYHIYAPMCTDSEPAKKFMDADVLVKMLTKWANKTLDFSGQPAKYPYHEDGYRFVLLCACAMTLGCQIPVQFTKKLRACYRHVGLMRDALLQVEKALEVYNNGEGIDFRSLGVQDSTDFEELPGAPGGFQMMNVEPPGLGGEVWRMMAHSRPDMPTNENPFPRRAPSSSVNPQIPKPPRFGTNVCGACGAKARNDGTGLVNCGKCRKQKYCGVKCQKKDWKHHKATCRVPSNE